MMDVIYDHLREMWSVHMGIAREEGDVSACPDGLGHFFVHVQMGNFFFFSSFSQCQTADGKDRVLHGASLTEEGGRGVGGSTATWAMPIHRPQFEKEPPLWRK